MSDLRALAGLLLLAVTASVTAQDEAVRDPTQPFVAAAISADSSVRPSGLNLTTVLISSSRRIAVIDGEFFREGDRVNGRLVTSIEPGAVRIGQGEDQLVLRIGDKQGVTDAGETSQ